VSNLAKNRKSNHLSVEMKKVKMGHSKSKSILKGASNKKGINRQFTVQMSEPPGHSESKGTKHSTYKYSPSLPRGLQRSKTNQTSLKSDIDIGGSKELSKVRNETNSPSTLSTFSNLASLRASGIYNQNQLKTFNTI
jgi:hypothetical protein